jgi:hypothetical protein
MKKIIRLTESDLTRLVRRVIKEQQEQGAKPIDLASLKSQVVGKKFQLTMKGAKIQSQYSDYYGKKAGDIVTTFLIDDVTNPKNQQLVFTGRDLAFTDARGTQSDLDFDRSMVKIKQIEWEGCKTPHYFTARGAQGSIVNHQVKGTPETAYLYVTNKTLSDMCFQSAGCAPDIDKTPDYQP